jgi:UDP-glucose 4-epimerase
MRILITGVRGFVGGSFGTRAAASGHDVFGVGRSSQSPVDWAGGYAQADVAHADLAPLIDFYRPDVVVHGAGTASVGGSFQAPVDDLRASALTLANTLDGVRRSTRRPVVLFPSSAAIYGRPAALPVVEDAPTAPISPYGFHKATCELVAREYAECFDVPVVVGRIFSVYGPGQRRLFVWEIFRQAEGAAGEVSVEGTGRETRDYLYIDDATDALLGLAVARGRESAARSAWVVNLASGVESSVGDVAARVCALSGCKKPVVCLNKVRPGDPPNWRADVSRIRELLPAWRPAVGLDEGLARCVSAWSGRG